MKGRMDWMRVPEAHKDLIKNIGKFLKTNPKGYRGYKKHVFSFGQFIKCLRGSMAHKEQYRFTLIKCITNAYPNVLDYLFEKQTIMQ
jgi:hypothetical protein